jgi:glutamine synthetase
MLNTIVAYELCQFADRLEKADDFTKELNKLLAETLKKHKRVIFNGNNYSEEWVKEAEKRGLKNYPTTVDCLPHYADDKNIAMFEKFKIFTKSEVQSRYEILIENYSKLIKIEALTMIDMAKKQILPAGIEFTKELCNTVSSKKTIGLKGGAEEKLAKRLSFLTDKLLLEIETLEEKTNKANNISDSLKLAEFCRDEIIPSMNEMRLYADEMETIVPEKLWPFPTYGELLFGVQ